MSKMNRNMLQMAMRQFIAMVIQAMITILTARILGPDGNGLYAMALMIPTVLSLVLGMGVESSIIYFINKKEITEASARGVAIWFWMIVSMFGLVIGYFSLQMFGGRIFPGLPTNIGNISLLLFPLFFGFGLLRSLYIAQDDYKWLNIFTVALPLLFLGLISALVICFGKVKVEWILISYVISYCLIMSMMALIQLKLGVNLAISLLKEYLSKFVFFGVGASGADVITFLNYRADLYLIMFFLSSTQAGIYYIGVQIVERLWVVSQSISTVLFPKLVSLSDFKEEMAVLTSKAFRISIVSTAILSLIVALFGVFFIEFVFGSAYSSAYTIIIILLPGIIFAAGSRVFSACISASGFPQRNMYSDIAVLLINVIFNIIFLKLFGVIGAALATSLSYLAHLFLRFLIVYKDGGYIGNFLQLIPRIADIRVLVKHFRNIKGVV